MLNALYLNICYIMNACFHYLTENGLIYESSTEIVLSSSQKALTYKSRVAIAQVIFVRSN